MHSKAGGETDGDVSVDVGAFAASKLGNMITTILHVHVPSSTSPLLMLSVNHAKYG